MFGLPDGVPVAAMDRAVQRGGGQHPRAVVPGVPAVLLANHGVLVFHRTPELAIVVGGVVEEAAQAGINAASLGGPVEIPAGCGPRPAARHDLRALGPCTRSDKPWSASSAAGTEAAAPHR